MTNKTINGVPQDLISVPRDILKCYLSGDGGDWVEAGHELRALLAAPDPIVEADGIGEPVMKLEAERLWVGAGEYAVSFVKAGWLDECRKVGGVFYLYSADQLAALQSTIAQLKAENERIQRISDNYSALLMDANAENERLRGGIKFPDHMTRERALGLTDYPPESCMYWYNKALDEVRQLNPLFAREPAPVSVRLPDYTAKRFFKNGVFDECLYAAEVEVALNAAGIACLDEVRRMNP